MNELASKLASITGIGVEDVSRLLCALADQAYAEAKSGFVLPGFGKFKIVRGEDTIVPNPFTGKMTTFRAPLEVEFTIDTKAKKAFLDGKAEDSDAIINDAVAETLLSVRLVPDQNDATAAGIDRKLVAEAVFKVGGEPDWIQAPETPICCGEEMLFYGQLDSLGGDYSLGDMGRLYVFLCQSCLSTRSILHCY